MLPDARLGDGGDSSPNMLPLAFRLKRRSEFGRIYSKGRSNATDLIVVYALPSRDYSTKIGFSVSKKVGGSVVRNRVRRLLREAVRPYLPQLKSGYSIIVLARVKAGTATLEQFTAALGTLFSRLGILGAGNQ
jgi:ribonuclease P protein component